MALHKDVTGTGLHIPAIVDGSDPGAIGAGKAWVDTSGGTGNWVLKIRNGDNDGWESAGGAGGGAVEDLVDLGDTPVDYGTDGQVLTTNGVDAATWETPVAGYPALPEEYLATDQQWNVIAFYGLVASISPSLESITGAVIGSGDGTTDNFMGSDFYFADPGSIAISVLLTDAETALITDDGDGVLEDAVNSVTGVVNYATGDWELTFGGAVPANLEDITADYDLYGSTAPTARITAYDFIRTIHGGYPPFEYGICLAGGGPPSFFADPKDAYLDCDCSTGIGQVLIEIWVQDVASNTQAVSSFAQITDFATICP